MTTPHAFCSKKPPGLAVQRVCFSPRGPQADVPYGVMRWFMDQVDEEIRTSRAWMRLRPDLVEIIRQLRQEHMGAIDDDTFRHVLAEVRATVPEADLPAVLEAAFGRRPDGTTMDQPQALPPADGQGG
ncbi:hypothetical protein ACFZCP_35815 [Streptomyces sp. NPDC007971]|uniref:hypothetical protein n=1 Tax=Streptomyces sp. NPDC007971 TaxID=3364799 RepID=UPI0036E50F46